MARQRDITAKSPASAASHVAPLVQRKCSCGSPTSALTDECDECKSKKRLQPKLAVGTGNDALESEAERVADEVMAEPGGASSPQVQGQAARASAGAPLAPPSVDRALAAAGQPLEPALRQDMEQRFGHDFSRVRVHADHQAARSAEAVGALAYTIGRDVVFGEGQYRPGTTAGMQLLAHELTHVVQQSEGSRGGVFGSPEGAEAEAQRVGSGAAASEAARVSSFVGAGTLQRQDKPNPLDEKAKAIIAKAKDKRPIEERGVSLVNDILTTYYAAEKAKVDAVEFNDAEAGHGLQTLQVGSGAGTKGKMFVGTEFTTNVDAFARRVLQVGHELIHIDQYRGGKLAGKGNKDKREFLAHQQQALAAEIPGTGRVSYATRLNMLDGALGYYYCLSDDDQKAKEFADKKDQLLKRRAEVDGKAGNDPVPEPKTCKRVE